MKQLFSIILLLATSVAYGQKVSVQVNGAWAEIPGQQTQGELKPGWKIVDIQLKDKLTHYLSGGHASQLTDDERPVFLIEPGAKETLVDYALIRLTAKKYYRKFPKSQLKDNIYTRLEPKDFSIKADKENGFICQPLLPLEKGEYILVNLEQKPIGELQDYIVYPFQIAIQPEVHAYSARRETVTVKVEDGKWTVGGN